MTITSLHRTQRVSVLLTFFSRCSSRCCQCFTRRKLYPECQLTSVRMGTAPAAAAGSRRCRPHVPSLSRPAGGWKAQIAGTSIVKKDLLNWFVVGRFALIQESAGRYAGRLPFNVGKVLSISGAADNAFGIIAVHVYGSAKLGETKGDDEYYPMRDARNRYCTLNCRPNPE